MKNNKIFILLPDGVGLRNFAYTNFYSMGKKLGFDLTYWNNTPFDLTSLGFQEIKIENNKNFWLTVFYKNARTQIELTLFEKRFKDSTYNSYRFPFASKTLKQKIKTFFTKCIIKYYNSETKLEILKRKINRFETQTAYYDDCVKTLKREKPAFVFCTNQRPITAIAPIQAAKKLGIPTGTFIFSWDNLPKATLVIDTDYYFVWSEFMKAQLQKYYPYIKSEQIIITGTPQFENHFNSEIRQTKEAFFKQHHLELTKKYICYSGDDITTSPNDPQYLLDTAQAVRNLNCKGFNLGIVFRRCPVDFSNRYDSVLKEFKDVIVPIAPVWRKIEEGWNTILPTPEDMVLQTNTIAHTEFVVNLGSSMVFDYVSYKKPCVYVNYDVSNTIRPGWNVEKIYKYIHFRSMPSKDAVVWFNSADEIEAKIRQLLEQTKDVAVAQKWFEIINQHPADKASERIWSFINKITS